MKRTMKRIIAFPVELTMTILAVIFTLMFIVSIPFTPILYLITWKMTEWFESVKSWETGENYQISKRA